MSEGAGDDDKPSYEYGAQVVIRFGKYSNPQLCKRAWVNAAKNPLPARTHLLVELVNQASGARYMDVACLSSESFVLKKDAIPKNVTEELMADHPQVRRAMRDAARLVARLGVKDGNDAAEMFLQMVTNHIELLKKRGPKANYLAINLEEDTYRAFYAASLERAKGTKRRHANGSDMHTE